MRRQDSKGVAGVFAALAVTAAAVACGGAVIRPEPSPAARATAVAGGCDTTGDCTGQEVCVDPRYPLCGAIPACEETGLIRCGCACEAIGATAGCAEDEVRGASGCCEPRTCTADAQCGRTDSRCLAGRCARRGTCQLMPP
ncbi:MAG: hypothetical protein ABW221_01230 [Vicinamibacteria bacterium]